MKNGASSSGATSYRLLRRSPGRACRSGCVAVVSHAWSPPSSAVRPVTIALRVRATDMPRVGPAGAPSPRTRRARRRRRAPPRPWVLPRAASSGREVLGHLVGQQLSAALHLLGQQRRVRRAQHRRPHRRAELGVQHQPVVDQASIRSASVPSPMPGQDEHALDQADPALDRHPQQRLGVLEVAVDRPQRDPRPGGHLLDRRGEVPLHEHLVDGVEDRLAVAVAAGGPAVESLGRHEPPAHRKPVLPIELSAPARLRAAGR